MATAWNDDPAAYEPVIEANAYALILDIIAAAPSRPPPTPSLAPDWHRVFYSGVPLPVPYYAGEFRDSDPRFPELIGHEVSVGSALGVSSQFVPAELARFAAATAAAVKNLDSAIPVGAALSQSQLTGVLRLMALVHGEWVRIHPFVNGNGRTARVWANWVAVRYGLPAFVRLKPRTAHLLYAGAGAASMRGDHDAMVVALHSMLRDYLVVNSPSRAGTAVSRGGRRPVSTRPSRAAGRGPR